MSRRTASLIAPVAYVAALVAVAFFNGLPLGHTALFFWILLGLAAFSLSLGAAGAACCSSGVPLLALLVAYD